MTLVARIRTKVEKTRHTRGDGQNIPGQRQPSNPGET